MARMMARKWLKAMGVGLCAYLCSACSHLGSHERPEDAASKKSILRPELEDHAVLFEGGIGHRRDDPADTSYHKLANPAPPTEAHSPGDPVRQVVYPDVPKRAASATEPADPLKPTLPARAPQIIAMGSAAEKPIAEHPLVAALRSFMEKKPEEAMAFLNRYDKPNQELLLCLLPLAVRLTDGPLSKARPEEITAIGEQIRSMEEPLRDHMELVMEKICFCEWIKGFGDYKPLDSGHGFMAGRRGGRGELMQVYLELNNLSWVKGERFYSTRLASSGKIIPRGSKEPIWEKSSRDHIVSRTLRHDYFYSYQFYLPHIPPGSYKLVVEVTDVPTGRKTSRSLDFRVSSLPAPN